MRWACWRAWWDRGTDVKLHSIELINVRGIEHLVIDELPDTGVVVIAGENEKGKSTIAEAIHVSLTFASASTA